MLNYEINEDADLGEQMSIATITEFFNCLKDIPSYELSMKMAIDKITNQHEIKEDKNLLMNALKIFSEDLSNAIDSIDKMDNHNLPNFFSCLFDEKQEKFLIDLLHRSIDIIDYWIYDHNVVDEKIVNLEFQIDNQFVKKDLSIWMLSVSLKSIFQDCFENERIIDSILSLDLDKMQDEDIDKIVQITLFGKILFK
jgi:hypothetical protein